MAALKKKENIGVGAGKGSNAKPVESGHRRWGNQKSSELVCVVGACVCVSACVCIYVCCSFPSTILSKQSTK